MDNCFSLSSASLMPCDGLVRLVDLQNNIVNRSGLHSWIHRSVIASPGCALIISDKDGQFNPLHTASRYDSGLIRWLSLRGKQGVEWRTDPVSITLTIQQRLGYNVDTACEDAYSYRLKALVMITDVARLVDSLGLGSSKPIISTSHVASFFENNYTSLLHVDVQGNIARHDLQAFFRSLGLKLLGQPAISDYRSDRHRAIRAAEEERRNQQRTIAEKRAKAAAKIERQRNKDLPKIIGQLARDGLDADQICEALKAIEQQHEKSLLRLDRTYDRQLYAAEQDYRSTVRRTGYRDNGRTGYLPAHNPPQLGQHQPPRLNAPRQPQQPHRAFHKTHAGADKTIVCRECDTPFIFTAGEQEFFRAHNFHDPVRCPTCRKREKQHE